MADNPLTDPGLAAIFGALGTAALAWLGNRLVGKAAIETAVANTYQKQTATFEALLDRLREELRVALAERDAARSLGTEQQAHIGELQRTIYALELRLANYPVFDQAALPPPVG